MFVAISPAPLAFVLCLPLRMFAPTAAWTNYIGLTRLGARGAGEPRHSLCLSPPSRLSLCNGRMSSNTCPEHPVSGWDQNARHQYMSVRIVSLDAHQLHHDLCGVACWTRLPLSLSLSLSLSLMALSAQCSQRAPPLLRNPLICQQQTTVARDADSRLREVSSSCE